MTTPDSEPFVVSYKGVSLTCAFVDGQPYFSEKDWLDIIGWTDYRRSGSILISIIGRCYSLYDIVMSIMDVVDDEDEYGNERFDDEIDANNKDEDSEGYYAYGEKRIIKGRIIFMPSYKCVRLFFRGIYPQLNMRGHT